MAFPDFGPIASDLSYSMNGYGQGWMFFKLIAGVGASKALYYIALTFTLIGGLTILFRPDNQNLKIIGSWLMLVLTMLVLPYRSDIFFTALDPKCLLSENYNALDELRKRDIEESIAKSADDKSGASSGCGSDNASLDSIHAFTPQLAATHIMGILHRVVFSGLYSQKVNGDVDVRNFIDDSKTARKLSSIEGLTIPIATVGYEFQVYRSLCDNPQSLMKAPYPYEGTIAYKALEEEEKGANLGLSGQYLTKAETESLRQQVFQAGKIMDLVNTYYTSENQRSNSAISPPFAVIYQPNDIDVITPIFTSFGIDGDEAALLARAADEGGEIIKEGLDAEDGIWPFNDDSGFKAYFDTADAASVNKLNAHSSGAAKANRFKGYKSDLNEAELEIYNDSNSETGVKIRSTAVMLGLMRPSKRLSGGSVSASGNYARNTGTRAVLGAPSSPTERLNGYAIQNCEQLHRVVRRFSNATMLESAGYNSGFIASINADVDPVYDNKQVQANISTGRVKESHLVIDDYYFDTLSDITGEYTTRLKSGSDVEAFAHEATRVGLLNRLHHDAVFSSGYTRTAVLSGSGASALDANIARANENTVFSAAGSGLGFVGTLIAKIGAVVGSFFVGVRAVIYLEFIKILVSMTEMFLLTITPLILMAGLIAPTFVIDAFLIVVGGIIAIKTIPITFTIVNALLHMMKYFLDSNSPLSAGLGVDESLLLWAAATIYTSIVAITLMMLPSAISNRAGYLNKVEGAANKIADEAATATSRLAKAAAMMATGMAVAGVMGAKGALDEQNEAPKLPDGSGGSGGSTPETPTNETADEKAAREAREAREAAEKQKVLEDQNEDQRTPAEIAEAAKTGLPSMGGDGSGSESDANVISTDASKGTPEQSLDTSKPAAEGVDDEKPAGETQHVESKDGDQTPEQIAAAAKSGIKPEDTEAGLQLQKDARAAAVKEVEDKAEKALKAEKDHSKDLSIASGKLGKLAHAGKVGLKQAAQVFTRSASNIPIISDVLREANPAGAYREGYAMSVAMRDAGGYGAYNQREKDAKYKEAFDYESGLAGKASAGSAMKENQAEGFRSDIGNTQSAGREGVAQSIAQSRANAGASALYGNISLEDQISGHMVQQRSAAYGYAENIAQVQKSFKDLSGKDMTLAGAGGVQSAMGQAYFSVNQQMNSAIGSAHSYQQTRSNFAAQDVVEKIKSGAIDNPALKATIQKIETLEKEKSNLEVDVVAGIEQDIANAKRTITVTQSASEIQADLKGNVQYETLQSGLKELEKKRILLTEESNGIDNKNKKKLSAEQKEQNATRQAEIEVEREKINQNMTETRKAIDAIESPFKTRTEVKTNYGDVETASAQRLLRELNVSSDDALQERLANMSSEEIKAIAESRKSSQSIRRAEVQTELSDLYTSREAGIKTATGKVSSADIDKRMFESGIGDTKWQAVKIASDFAIRGETDKGLIDSKVEINAGIAQAKLNEGKTLEGDANKIYRESLETYNKARKDGNVGANHILRYYANLEAAPEKSEMWAKTESMDQLDKVGMDWSKKRKLDAAQYTAKYKGIEAQGGSINLEAEIASATVKGTIQRAEVDQGLEYNLELLRDPNLLVRAASGRAASDYEKVVNQVVKALEGGTPNNDKVVQTVHGPQKMDGSTDSLASILAGPVVGKMKAAFEKGDSTYTDDTGITYNLKTKEGKLDQNSIKKAGRAVGRPWIARLSQAMNEEGSKLFKETAPRMMNVKDADGNSQQELHYHYNKRIIDKMKEIGAPDDIVQSLESNIVTMPDGEQTVSAFLYRYADDDIAANCATKQQKAYNSRYGKGTFAKFKNK